MNSPKPNFLVVGAAKAGTTALYYYLKQHPEIGFPNLKEPKYFSSQALTFPHNGIGDKSVDKYAIKEWGEYVELFKDLKTKKFIGEASPDYLYYHQYTAPLIKKKLGDIPIIIMLRNPIKRAFSAYSYLKRDNRENLSFIDALRAEKHRIQNNWDFIWHYKKGSEYSAQISSFKSIFSSVHIIIFEDFICDPLVETNKILNFLGVSELTSLKNLKHNVSGIPNNFFAKNILRRDKYSSTILREIIKNVFPRSLLEKLSTLSMNKFEISEEEYSYLKGQLISDIKKTEKVLGQKIRKWE